MAYANLTNLPNKGVDLSNVTQAATGSPLFNRGGSSGAAQASPYQNPSGGNPNTSLYNAGAVSQMGQNFANYGQKVGQISIPGPSGQSSGGGGQPQIQPGSYDAKTLSQDQRQSLWEYFGHKGVAPLGYGGENPRAPIVDNPSTITSFLPSFTPPPAPVPSATFQPQGASGATSPQTGLSTGGGVSGQAFQAPTLMANAVKGLQNITSLPSSVIGGLVKQLSTPGMGIFSSPTSQAQTQTQKPLVQGYNPQADTGGARDVLKPFGESVQKTAQDILLGGGQETLGRLPIRAVEALPELLSGVSKFAKPALAGITGALGFGSTAPANEAEGTYRNRQFGETTPEGDFKAAQKGTTPATTKNILGNIAPKDAPQAIITAVREPKKMDDVVAGIASEEVKPVLISMMQTASQQGDMDTAQKLLAIYNGVQKQINFNNMIQQAVTAISAGFGTPNAPGVTEARTPQVQQGIGSALEASPSQAQIPQQQLASQIPYLPANLQTANPIQQQRPALSSFMGQ